MRLNSRFSAIAGIFTIISSRALCEILRCVDDSKMVLMFEGGPSERSIAALDMLKKLNARGIFLLDGERLRSPRFKEIASNLYAHGMDLGLHASAETFAGETSTQGLLFALGNQIDLFKAVTGKSPLFIGVPSDFDKKMIAFLEGAGFIVLQPTIDVSNTSVGDCANALSNALHFSGEGPALSIRFSDAETSCIKKESEDIIDAIKSFNKKIVPISECVGTDNAYRSEISLPNVDLTPFVKDVQDNEDDGTSQASSQQSSSSYTKLNALLLIVALLITMWTCV